MESKFKVERKATKLLPSLCILDIWNPVNIIYDCVWVLKRTFTYKCYSFPSFSLLLHLLCSSINLKSYITFSTKHHVEKARRIFRWINLKQCSSRHICYGIIYVVWHVDVNIGNKLKRYCFYSFYDKVIVKNKHFIAAVMEWLWTEYIIFQIRVLKCKQIYPPTTTIFVSLKWNC